MGEGEVVGGQIERELAEFRENPGKSSNWVGYLPGGAHRQMVDFMEKSDNPAIRELPNNKYPQYNGKSVKELFGDVDIAIEEEKVSLDKITNLISHHSKSINSGTPEGRKTFGELVGLTLPVYQNLRRKGYPKEGLTS